MSSMKSSMPRRRSRHSFRAARGAIVFFTAALFCTLLNALRLATSIIYLTDKPQKLPPAKFLRENELDTLKQQERRLEQIREMPSPEVRHKLGQKKLLQEDNVWKRQQQEPHEFNWLDAIVDAQYPSNPSQRQSPLSVVYPADWKRDDRFQWDDYLQRRSKKPTVEVTHASWTGPRVSGIGNMLDGGEDNGAAQAVRGRWPDKLTDLSMISVVKVGHTKLTNAMGDLRQRLNGTSTLLRGENDTVPILEEAARRQLEQRGVHGTRTRGHAVFAMVRDPVDRFISATCQDMSFGLTPDLVRGCFPNRPGNFTALEMVDCAISRIRDEHKWGYHQEEQVYQIIRSVGPVESLGVTLIPFERAMGPVLAEIGGTPHKVRDREEHQDYDMTLCTLKPAHLMLYQQKEICELYRADVRMLQYAGMAVPLCEQDFSQAVAASTIHWEKPKPTDMNVSLAQLGNGNGIQKNKLIDRPHFHAQ